jgi:CheY-like chemotaxis protein
MGIGLTLVKKLVELHDGTVEASSPGLGQGSEFIVRLPALNAATPGVTAASPTQGSAALPPRRLLVVDDNQDAADSLALLLRLSGQDVRVAYDGHAAVELARTFRPELVFLDIGLPGMDGYDVAKELRQTLEMEQLILVALTGWGQEEDRKRSAAAGFDHHLVKPVEPRALELLLAALIPPKRFNGA